MIVLLDAGPLGMVSNPNASITNSACYQWMESLVLNGDEVLVPEIADYEVRRELLRAQKTRGLARLDILKNSLGYLPLATSVIRKHGIDFLTAQWLWEDPRLIEVSAQTVDEPRRLVIGQIAGKHWSAVITYRSEVIRIISVQRSRRNEVLLRGASV